MDNYNVIGIMSGTSLDGLDIASCTFIFSENKKWSFKINASKTINYPQKLKNKLANAKNLSGTELMFLNNEFAYFIGLSINEFIFKNKIKLKKIDAISSHGHTIFHQPNIKLTTQIGSGSIVSSITELPVICDFRNVDISLGGQGAPLVPIGDKLLFSEYDYCINLGGIANISYQEKNKQIAFDICPVNIVLNKLAHQKGLAFDRNGELAEKGNINERLLEDLSLLPYYRQLAPKSLGIEWVEENIFPILDAYNIAIEDKLRTFTVHIAQQIRTFLCNSDKKVLFTGGGTYNSFLMKNIKFETPCNIIIPNKELIDFKEALIFAFLGVLRLRKEVNCLASVTGADRDNIGGCIYQAF